MSISPSDMLRGIGGDGGRRLEFAEQQFVELTHGSQMEPLEDAADLFPQGTLAAQLFPDGSKQAVAKLTGLRIL